MDSSDQSEGLCIFQMQSSVRFSKSKTRFKILVSLKTQNGSSLIKSAIGHFLNHAQNKVKVSVGGLT